MGYVYHRQLCWLWSFYILAVEERPFRAAFPPILQSLGFQAPAAPMPLAPQEIRLEKAMRYIKGGFSFRAKEELVYPGSVWQPSFGNHRIHSVLFIASLLTSEETISIKTRCAEGLGGNGFTVSQLFSIAGAEIDSPPALKRTV